MSNRTSQASTTQIIDDNTFLTGSNITVPTSASVQAYVDTTAQGLHVLKPADAATTGVSQLTAANSRTESTLTYTSDLTVSGINWDKSEGTLSIDSVSITSGSNRILIKDYLGTPGSSTLSNSSSNLNNGIYIATFSADADLVFTRTSDFAAGTGSTSSPINVRLGDFLYVTGGSINAGHGFAMVGASNFNYDGTSGIVGSSGAHAIQFSLFSGISETVTVNQGGTGATTLTDGSVLLGSGTSPITAQALGDTQILIGDSSGDPTVASLSGDVTMTNAGVVTIGANTFTNTNASDGYEKITSALSGTPNSTDSILARQSNNTLFWADLSAVCFLKGTKITLPNHEQKAIEDLKLGDQVLTYHVEGLSNLRKKDKVKIMNWSQDSMEGSFKNSKVRNIWVNPADQYLILNEKLKLTNKHIIHVKRDNEFKFLPAENARIGDELFTDREHYEEIHTIEQKNEKVEVYNIEVSRNRTYFAENYLVHHFCETCAGFAERI